MLKTSEVFKTSEVWVADKERLRKSAQLDFTTRHILSILSVETSEVWFADKERLRKSAQLDFTTRHILSILSVETSEVCVADKERDFGSLLS